VSAIDVTRKVFFERLYWFQDWAQLSSESTVRMLPHPHCSLYNYFSISVQFVSDVAPHFLSAHDSSNNLAESRYPPPSDVSLWQSLLSFDSSLSLKKRFEQWELPAKLLDYFLWSNKSNINRTTLVGRQDDFSNFFLCVVVLACFFASVFLPRREDGILCGLLTIFLVALRLGRFCWLEYSIIFVDVALLVE